MADALANRVEYNATVFFGMRDRQGHRITAATARIDKGRILPAINRWQLVTSRNRHRVDNLAAYEIRQVRAPFRQPFGRRDLGIALKRLINDRLR